VPIKIIIPYFTSHLSPLITHHQLLWKKGVDFFENMVYNLFKMRRYIFNKKSPLIILAILLFFLLFYSFFFKSTEAQVCLPLTGYLVWPGTWEPGRIPMASTSQYTLAPSPLFVDGSNVGIGTRSPVYTFQVNGDISGTRLCIGSDCRSIWPGGGIAGSGSSGQVTFWTDSTSVGGDNNFFWDNTNKRLGIGTITPQTSLHVIGNIIANTFSGTINAANVSSGQFGANTGGGNYSFPGNVGIGTMEPSSKLHLADPGQVELRLSPGTPGGAESDAFFRMTGQNNSPNEGFLIEYRNSVGDVYLKQIWRGISGSTPAIRFSTGNTPDAMVISGGGNVGIGTTTPAEKLDVKGVLVTRSTVNNVKIFEAKWGGNAGGYISVYKDGNENVRLSAWSGAGDSWLGMESNVGIGTMEPSSKLHLADPGQVELRLSPGTPGGAESDAFFRMTGQNNSPNEGFLIQYRNSIGDVYLKQIWTGISGSTPAIRFSTGNTTDAMVISGGGNVGIGTTAPTHQLHIFDGSGIRVSAQSNWVNIPNPGSSAIAEHAVMNARGFSYLADGALLSSSVTSGIGIAINRVNPAVAIRNNGGPGLIVENGNVGIGTIVPEYKLDIAGALRLQPSSTPTAANGVIYYDSTVNKFKCHENGAWKDCIGAGGGGFWAANGNKIYNTNTGNVGIGTTEPGAALDTRITSAAGVGTLIAQFGSQTAPRILLYDEGETSGLGPKIHFNAGWVGRITGAGNIAIMPTGNVGIGTTLPETKLDVAGGIIANQGINICSNPVGGYSFRGDGCYDTGMFSTSDGYLQFYTNGGERIRIDPNGNVGIGTMEPGQKLDVVGGYIRSNTGFCIGTSCITSWPSGGGVSGSGTTNYIAKWTGSTSLGNSIIYDNGTNVGIGTTPTNYRLTVNGSVYASEIYAPYFEICIEYNSRAGTSSSWGVTSYADFGDWVTFEGFDLTGVKFRLYPCQ
jgi:hypothetical protein